jgi:pantetheine-phosphate adenylyltransferase
MRTAVYPGTFDPITNGHLDIIKRASALFDRVIVAVAENQQKRPLLSRKERRNLVLQAVKEISNVEVSDFDGLLVDYAKSVNACAIIRGLRAVSDFEYEFQMALMNRKLCPELETVYLMPSEKYTYINSTIVKEIARLGGSVDCFLPAAVLPCLKKKLKENG